MGDPNENGYFPNKRQRSCFSWLEVTDRDLNGDRWDLSSKTDK